MIHTRGAQMKSKLMLCENCNADISKNATRCPYCGAVYGKNICKKACFLLLAGILALGTLLHIFF